VEETNLKLAERELAKAITNESNDRKEAEYALKKAESDYAYAKTELEAAKSRQQADRQLFEKGGLSKLQYDESLQELQRRENELADMAMELDRAAKKLTDFDKDRDEKLYKLRSNVELIIKNINSLKSKVDAETRADIDGKVVKLETEGDVDILIYDMSRYVVSIELKQQEALYVKEGMKAKIEVKGLDEKQYNGTVVEVGQVALAEAGSTGAKVEVKVNIDNPDEDIKTGYVAEVQIDLSMKNDAVVVDFEAIIQDVDGKKYIYYVENDMARKRTISTGIETSFEVEITEGLIQGDRYVVNPPEDMQEKNSMRIWGWRYESK
jgi:HlyD family secretion protein